MAEKSGFAWWLAAAGLALVSLGNTGCGGCSSGEEIRARPQVDGSAGDSGIKEADAADARSDAGDAARDGADGCLDYEICNGLDDDCDGQPDDGDPGAGQSCNTGLSGACAVGTTACVSGAIECRPNVPPAAETCNGLDDDCNNAIDDVPAGALNSECATSNPSAAHVAAWRCTTGACQIGNCDAGFADCNGSVVDGCEVDTRTSASNCGGCGNACPNANGTPTCSDGHCSITCNAGFGDCDTDRANGCETNTNVSSAHCGQCNQPCANSTGPASCVGGICDKSCSAGLADCDRNATNGCEIDIRIDRDHCGSCTTRCTNLHGSTSCVAGACTPICAPGFADCNSNPNDGCEGATTTYYSDVDRDRYGDPTKPLAACTQPAGRVSNSGDCDDADPQRFPGNPEVCDGKDNDCNLAIDDAPGCCQTSVDADFDGANECVDCDDSDGSIHIGAIERCNGVDDNCNGVADETFDVDRDGFTTCDSNPARVDCNDANASVNPGVPESCGASGSGNGVDDNCNGYVDEGCTPCNPSDTDGDGVSECQGDCAPSDGAIRPGLPERCDGKDNDCNVFTVDNCGVSDPCNFDQDGDPSNDTDTCQADLICGCVVTAGGQCTGNYRCTSFCNTSTTGPLGDGCGANQVCLYDLLRSANVHGCAITTSAPGQKRGGEACANDSECRSGSCDRLCVGPGCTQSYCIDWCGSDAYCAAANTVCRLSRSADNIDGRCWPAGFTGLGSAPVGSSCTTDGGCDRGFCLQSVTPRYCTEACCSDRDCGAGFGCSLAGDQVDTNTAFVPPKTQACTGNAGCTTGLCLNGECAFRMTESSPMCLRDATGQGTRLAGAACTTNTECASHFCERALGICVDPCCSEATCPNGLSCELSIVEVPRNAAGERRVTQARVCVNVSTDGVLSPR